MRRSLFLSCATVFLAAIVASGAPPEFVPLPECVEYGTGRFRLGPGTAIVAPAVLANEANFLAGHLRAVARLPAPVVAEGRGIELSLDASLPAEGYTLQIDSVRTVIRGGSPSGVFYGVQTFMQTLPAAVYGDDPVPDADWSAPALRILDRPAKGWRGVMLDSARHFQPKAFVLKLLDAMAAQKLNRLHWHLTDNEAWRLEIKKYPKLTSFAEGAPAYYPEEIPTNASFRPKYRYGWPHGGGFYSQADVREIVAYATARHIVVVPELEIPGHACAALAAYPEYSVTRRAPEVRSPHSPDLFGVHPEAVFFLKDILRETMELFPGPWIHLGGDEPFRNADNEWRKNPDVQDTIDALGLRVAGAADSNASEEALHAWLFNTLSVELAAKGRRAIGWEEITLGDKISRLSPKPAVLTWLVSDQAIKAANAGYDIILADGFALYLDSRQTRDKDEPQALYDGPFTAQSIHRFNLLPAGISPENRGRVLGAEVSLWTEFMPRTEDVEYQAFPRACAFAELVWTSPERRDDTADFMNRLAAHGARLTALGLNHRRVEAGTRLGWTPKSLAAGKFAETSLPADLAASVLAGGKLSLKFDYIGGVDGLRIAGVDLLADGAVVASDRHAGFAGNVARDEVYALAWTKGRRTAKLALRIVAAGEGGDDSVGEVLVTAGR